MHSLYESYKAFKLAGPAAITATANATGVDLIGLKKDILVVLNIGVVSGTSPTDALNIQTSPDNTNWTTQASFALVTGSASKIASARIRLPVLHRYIRVSETIGGTDTPTFNRSVIALVRAEREGATLNSGTPA
jgi:hypothetical protein